MAVPKRFKFKSIKKKYNKINNNFTFIRSYKNIFFLEDNINFLINNEKKK